MSALIRLAEKVEAGTVGDGLNTSSVFGDNQTAMDAVDAYYGSLDAAKALHDAVLPGWIGSFATDGFAQVAKGGSVLTVMQSAHIDGQPARAWLLAILRAAIAAAKGDKE